MIDRLEPWCPECGKRIEPKRRTDFTREKFGRRHAISIPHDFTDCRCDNGCINVSFALYLDELIKKIKRQIEAEGRRITGEKRARSR
jgi:hypothetical protein